MNSDNLWFVGIAICEYENYPNLNNAVNDVGDIKELLSKSYGLKEDQTIILNDHEATRESIIKTFDFLEDNISEIDSLILYYAGHGTIENNKGFWIPTNASTENSSNYIRNSTIRDYIEVINSKHTFLICDSCFSGSFFVRGGTPNMKKVNELSKIKSRWALSSGRTNQLVSDGIPGSNSPFCASILHVLDSVEHEINIAKLINSVIDLTRFEANQLPEGNPLFGVGHKGGQLVLKKNTNILKKVDQTKEEKVEIVKQKKELPVKTNPKNQEITESKAIQLLSNKIREFIDDYLIVILATVFLFILPFKNVINYEGDFSSFINYSVKFILLALAFALIYILNKDTKSYRKPIHYIFLFLVGNAFQSNIIAFFDTYNSDSFFYQDFEFSSLDFDIHYTIAFFILKLFAFGIYLKYYYNYSISTEFPNNIYKVVFSLFNIYLLLSLVLLLFSIKDHIYVY